MKILIAEDDPVSRRVLQATLQKLDFEVSTVSDGNEAWAALRDEDEPTLAIFDWMMPGMDGVDVCRAIRNLPRQKPLYIILLTAKSNKADVVAGLGAGADDYLIKPFDRDELRARVQVGVRFLALQANLAERVMELEEALAKVKLLQGLLPMCSYCKKIRDDRNYWQRVDNYIENHSEAKFSHSICPDCYRKVLTKEI